MIRWTSWLFFVSVATVGITFSGFLAKYFHDFELKAAQHKFEIDIHDQAASLEREIRLQLESLYSLKDFFDNSEEVTSEEFQNFTNGIISRHPDLTALEWAPRVVGSVRDDFSQGMKKQKLNFEISEKGVGNLFKRAAFRQEYFPVAFASPIIGNEAIVGFDQFSEDLRKKTLEQVRDQGELLVSDPIILLQDTSKQKGCLVCLPVYKGSHNTLESRRENLVGFVLAILSFEKIVLSSQAYSSKSNNEFYFVDRTREPAQNLYDGRTNLNSYENSTTQICTLRVNTGRTWVIEGRPTKEFLKLQTTNIPWIVLGAGSIFTLLILGYAFVFQLRHSLVQVQVEERTRQLAEANIKLEKLTRVDVLSDLANRRFFNEHLNKVWISAAREAKPVTLVMVDIDFFKQYNDTFGHPAGDSCLRAVADALKACFSRPDDLVARYGGEEFAIIMPNTDAKAFEAIDRCRSNVENLGLPHTQSQVSSHVTVSIGMAVKWPKPNQSSQTLIDAADKALYEAKQAGRNRVIINT